MTRVNISHARTHLSRLLREVEQGSEVVICRAGTPVARLVREVPMPQRRLGEFEGRFYIADDFDAPLPKALEDAFYSEAE